MPWSPNNKYLWDFWFAWKGEELHAFYLQADKAECRYHPEARHNLASVGHAVLTRWGWKEVHGQEVLSRAQNEGWDNFSIWTGSIIQPAADSPYHLFYTSRRREDEPLWTPSEWQRPQHIGVAVSTDLLKWQQPLASISSPAIPNPGRESGLDGIAWRDPWVMRGEDGLFYAFICARLDPENNLSPLDAGGVIAFVSSPDLKAWETMPRLVVCPNEFYQMEVPQVFWRVTERGKRFYLLFSAQERDCSRARRERGLECQTGTYYLHSRLLPLDDRGIPELEESARLLAPGLYSGKLLRPETGKKTIFFGFPWADPAGHFVGGISDPLIAHFRDDGTIELEA
jgi:beta-fructofuranosidase